jgi:hypothetical protein
MHLCIFISNCIYIVLMCNVHIVHQTLQLLGFLSLLRFIANTFNIFNTVEDKTSLPLSVQREDC